MTDASFPKDTSRERILILPDDFDNYAWEVEAKGYFGDARVKLGERFFPVAFYDPVRLSQEIGADVEAGKVFSVPRLIVVPSVTKENMRASLSSAADDLFVDE